MLILSQSEATKSQSSCSAHLHFPALARCFYLICVMIGSFDWLSLLRQLCLLPLFVIQFKPFRVWLKICASEWILCNIINYYSLQGCSQALQDFAKSKMAVIGGIGVGIAILQVMFYITKINWLIIIEIKILLVMF